VPEGLIWIPPHKSVPAWQKCLLTCCPAGNPPGTRPDQLNLWLGQFPYTASVEISFSAVERSNRRSSSVIALKRAINSRSRGVGDGVLSRCSFFSCLGLAKNGLISARRSKAIHKYTSYDGPLQYRKQTATHRKKLSSCHLELLIDSASLRQATIRYE